MGDGLGVLIVGDLKRVDQSTLVQLRLREVQVVLQSHKDVAELVRDLVGLDAEDVVRGLVEPVGPVYRRRWPARPPPGQLFKRVKLASVGARSFGSSPGRVSVMNDPC